jgi:putative membrane protein
MSEHVKSTISLYKSLFKIPSSPVLLLIVIVLTIVVGGFNEVLRNFAVYPFLPVFVIGAVRGIIITLPSAALALVGFWFVIRNNGFLNTNRLLGVITTATGLLLSVWLLSTLLGWCVELIFKFFYGPLAGVGLTSMFYLRGLILAAAFTSAIILLVVLSASRVGVVKGAFLTLILPTVTIVSFIFTEPLFWPGFWLTYLGIYLLSATLFVSASWILLSLVGKPLKTAFEIDGIQLFRGFLEVWMEGKADLMEESLTQIGKEQILPLSIIKFKTEHHDPRLVYVVAGVHPGPFRKTGSSALPSYIAEWGRNDLQSIACAPHGTATHDLNLVSKIEVQRFMKRLRGAYEKTTPVGNVSQFVRTSSGTIQVGCQIFGDTAFLVITRSPHEMDDISLKVAKLVSDEVTKLVNRCIVVDTHNCMTELKESVYEDSELVPDIIKASVTATRQALKTPNSRAQIGVVTQRDTGFSTGQGMGPEGITVLVVEVSGQKTAYVLIDGNNMVVGLREKLLQELVPSVVDAAEIMTSDTHETAAISAHNGYSPIGEAIPYSALKTLITDLVKNANNNLEPATIELFQGDTGPLVVMGDGTVAKLTGLIPVSANIAKRVGIIAYGTAMMISLLLLLFIVPLV